MLRPRRLEISLNVSNTSSCFVGLGVPRPFHIGFKHCVVLLTVGSSTFACSAFGAAARHIIYYYVVFAVRLVIGLGTLWTGRSLLRFLAAQGRLTVGRKQILVGHLSWSGGLLIIGECLCVLCAWWTDKPSISTWFVFLSYALVNAMVGALHVFSFMRPEHEIARGRQECHAQERATPCPSSMIEQVHRGVSLNLLRGVSLEIRRMAPLLVPANLRAKMAEDLRYTASWEERVAFTTADVTHQLVKPRTRRNQCPYVMLAFGTMDVDGRLVVGRATHFVSHSWLYEFQVLFAILEDCACADYYWIDCFAINQHRVLDAGELDQLGPTSLACGNLLLAASPWSAPLPFTRVWCLFEIHIAWQNGVEIDLQVGLQDKRNFFNRLSDNYAAVEHVLSQIDARLATATVKSDRDYIFELIVREIGFEQFNSNLRSIVQAALRNFVYQRMF